MTLREQAEKAASEALLNNIVDAVDVARVSDAIERVAMAFAERVARAMYYGSHIRSYDEVEIARIIAETERGE